MGFGVWITGYRGCMGYGMPCEPTWWTEKGMEYLWVIKAMNYEGVDCSYFQIE